MAKKEKNIIITTTDNIPGKELEIVGIVQGSEMQSTKVVDDCDPAIRALLRKGDAGILGLAMDTARKLAMRHMADEAKKIKADAVISVRITHSAVLMNMSQVVAYGTAVRIVRTPEEQYEERRVALQDIIDRLDKPTQKRGKVNMLKKIEQETVKYESGKMMRADSEIEISVLLDENGREAVWVCDYSETRGSAEPVIKVCYVDELPSKHKIAELCDAHHWAYTL